MLNCWAKLKHTYSKHSSMWIVLHFCTCGIANHVEWPRHVVQLMETETHFDSSFAKTCCPEWKLFDNQICKPNGHKMIYIFCTCAIWSKEVVPWALLSSTPYCICTIIPHWHPQMIVHIPQREIIQADEPWPAVWKAIEMHVNCPLSPFIPCRVNMLHEDLVLILVHAIEEHTKTLEMIWIHIYLQEQTYIRHFRRVSN